MRNEFTHQLIPKRVRAVQFDPDVRPWPECVLEFFGYTYEGNEAVKGFVLKGDDGRIRTGDWIVTDELGSRIVRHEAFNFMYEPVEGLSKESKRED